MSAFQTYLVTNWKTSATGVALIILAGLEYAGVPIPGVKDDPIGFLTQALIAFGLIAAKDAGKP